LSYEAEQGWQFVMNIELNDMLNSITKRTRVRRNKSSTVAPASGSK
jgi:hypothetical protein